MLLADARSIGLVRDQNRPRSQAQRSIRRMTEHQKKTQEKTSLPFKWVESDPFEMKPIVRTAADASSTSDTAFLLKPKSPGRPNQAPRT